MQKTSNKLIRGMAQFILPFHLLVTENPSKLRQRITELLTGIGLYNVLVMYYLSKSNSLSKKNFKHNFMQEPFNPIQDRGNWGGKKEPQPVFSLYLLQMQELATNLSEFQFEPFYHTGVKLQGHIQYQFQIIELEPRASLKKIVFFVKCLQN